MKQDYTMAYLRHLAGRRLGAQADRLSACLADRLGAALTPEEGARFAPEATPRYKAPGVSLSPGKAPGRRIKS